MDPAFLAAHWSYVMHHAREGSRVVAWREYSRQAAPDDRRMACLALMARVPGPGGGIYATEAVALARRSGLDDCLTVLLATLLVSGREIEGLPSSLELQRRATRLMPELRVTWATLVTHYLGMGDRQAADSVLGAALAHVRHPLERLPLLEMRARLTLERGDTVTGNARLRAIGTAVERDGRSLLLFNHWLNLLVRQSPAVPDRQRLERLLRDAPPSWRLQWRTAEFHVAYTRSDFAGAMSQFERVRALADSVPDPDVRVQAHLVMGRALSKMGRFAEARQLLLRSASMARQAGMPYSIAEAWHNLSHTYEGLDRLDQALAASDSFVRYAAPLEREPIRIISRHDAGLLRLRLGWHAAAHAQFDTMVQLISQERQNHYWAGEYFERTGRTRSAIEFFRKGLADNGERSLNLAGLVRGYESLGLADSAAIYAALHDASILSPAEILLEPEVLSRAGRHEQALRLTLAFAQRQERAGNLHGAALARMQQARLLLAAGRPRNASRAARRAEAHALAAGLDAERIDALRLRGVAAARGGHATAALPLLRQAAHLALRRADVRQVREAHLALGDASVGTAEALAAYDRAAAAVQQAAVQFGDDLDRARYRAAHMAPFDAALRRLARDSSPRELAYWSARRKAAALALATAAPTPAIDPLVLEQVQRQLADDHAVVDFTLLSDFAAAIVVRAGSAAFIRLPGPADSVTALARRLMNGAGRRGERVDLARIRFDRAAAAELYHRLLAPLLPALAGVNRVTLIPDAELHHVPFAALVTPAGYLLDELELDYALSLAFTVRQQPNGWDRASLLLVRTEVPGGERERDAVYTSWQRVARPVLELAHDRATEGAVAAMSARASIVHFATHAEVSNRNPLITHLRIAPGGGGDGMLHLAEIASGTYANRLVVLAGCESAAGELLTGEGFVGLARAFLAAGAAGVVATRWPVDASAAEFSAAFYAALGRGLSVAGATRESQRTLARTGGTSHPFFWAGYVAIR